MHGYLVGRGTGDLLLQAERVKDALVQELFGETAVPHLLVVVVEALPVRAECGQAGFVDVVDASVGGRRGGGGLVGLFRWFYWRDG